MASRELIYRVTFRTAQARREARNFRSALEQELRTIRLGKVDTSPLAKVVTDARAQGRNARAALEQELRAIRMGEVDSSSIVRATQDARALRHELEQAGQASQGIQIPTGSGRPSLNTGSGAGGASGLLAGLAGGAAIGLAIKKLQDLGKQMIDLSRRGAVFGQLGDVLNDYAASVGSSADRMLAAATKASQGTISQYELILNANRAIQFEVAKTPEAYAKLIELSTALGRAQGIVDTQALEYLTTGLARESRLILDNLGLIINVKEAQAQYAREIGKTADELTTAERKAALLNEAYRQGETAIQANRDAADSAATQFERFDANVQNLKDTFGDLFATAAASKVKAIADAIERLNNEVTIYAKGTDAGTNDFETFLQNSIKDFENYAKEVKDRGGDDSIFRGGIIASKEALQVFEAVNAAIDKGIPGAEKYEDEVKTIVESLINGAIGAPEAVSELRRVNAELEALASDPKVLAAAEQAKKVAEENAAAQERLKYLAEQEEIITGSLLDRARQSVEQIGADQAVELYRQAKAQAEAALLALQDSGINDATELQFRVEEIVVGLTSSMDEAIKAAEEAASAFNVDAAVPTFDKMSAAMSDINAGFVDLLPGVVAAREELFALSTEMAYGAELTDEQTARLNFLSGVAAAVGDETSILGGAINELGTEFLSSNEYAAALVEQLVLAEGAFRSGQISADVYAGITTVLSGRLLILAQNAGIATSQLRALNQAQADMASGAGIQVGRSIGSRVQSQQAAREREANRKEAERVAREQERAAKAAAREQERAAKNAANEAKRAAQAAAQELENALRKVAGLFDVSQVTEGDFEDTKLGIYMDKADEKLRRLRDEVLNGVDWADVSVEEAKAALERVGIKAADSAEGILKQFEDAWASSALFSDEANISWINEDAVRLQLELQEKAKQGEQNILKHFGVVIDEAVDTVTSGGGGGGSEVEITPAQFQNSAAIIQEAVQKGTEDIVVQAAQTVKEAFERKGFTTAGSTSDVLRDSVLGGGIKAKVEITADDKAESLVPLITGQSQAPTIVPTATIQPELAENAGEQIALALGAQLGTQGTIFLLHGQAIGGLITSGISKAMALTEKGDVTIDVAGLVAGNLSAQTQTFVNQGKAIAGLISQGIAEGPDVAEGQVEKAAPSITVQPALPDNIGSTLLSDLADALAPQTASFIEQGKTIGEALKSGVSQALSLGAKGEINVDVAGFVAGNLSAQTQTFIDQGKGIAGLISQGITEGPDTTEGSGNQVTVAVRTVLPENVGDTLVNDLDAALSTKTESFLAQGKAVGDTIKDGIGQAMALGAKGEVNVDIAGFIAGNLSAQYETIVAQGKGVAGALMKGIEQGSTASTDASGEQSAPLVDAFIQNFNTQARTKTDALKREGQGVASAIIAGATQFLKGQQQGGASGAEGGAQASTDLADAFLTNVRTQFTTTGNMFYTAGWVPATNLQNGFKAFAYEGLAGSFLEALTTNIREKQADFLQRGGTMAAAVQAGFIAGFDSEAFKQQLIDVGKLMYTFIEIGILAQVNGAKLTTAIATKVVEDLNAELEQP